MLFLVFHGFACASAPVFHKDELIYLRKDRIPFGYQFPARAEGREEEIPSLEKREKKSMTDLWKLARYYHLIAEDEGHLAKALVFYNVLVKLDKTDTVYAQTNAACVLASLGRYADSEKAFHAILGGKTEVEYAYYNLYLLYRYCSRGEDSLRVLLLMRKKYPRSVFPPLELGNIYFEGEQYDQAAVYYREAAQFDGRNPLPVYRLARIGEQKRDYREAERLYKECLKKHPDFCRTYIDYSRMLMNLNRDKEAKEIIRIGLKRCADLNLSR